MKVSSIALLLLTIPCLCLAWYPRLQENALLTGSSPMPLVGTDRHYQVGQGDSLPALARSMGLGYANLLAANPGIDPWLPPEGKLLRLPYRAILSGKPSPGITVNLAELRLYLVWSEKGLLRVRIYPIGIGREGFKTPEGRFTIRNKVSKPAWSVPEVLRLERPELPAQVPPGPDNPLGGYWLGFSRRGHGIHGTNQPYGIGRQVSHGCIRLYPEDISDLFARVSPGTPVQIVNQPVKVGISGNTLYIEAHPDQRGSDRKQEITDTIRQQTRMLNWPGDLSWDIVDRILEQRLGIPVAVSSWPESRQSVEKKDELLSAGTGHRK